MIIVQLFRAYISHNLRESPGRCMLVGGVATTWHFEEDEWAEDDIRVNPYLDGYNST
jgi:hypothetical protein